MTILKQIWLEGIAIHEAGHAVTAVVLGLPVSTLSMTDVDGNCFIDRDSTMSDADDAEKLIVAALAGQWAQWQYRRATCKFSDYKIDEELIREQIGRMCKHRLDAPSIGNQILHLSEHASDLPGRMQTLVDANERSILRVGFELLRVDDRMLSGKQVSEIMETRDGTILSKGSQIFG
jgi:hypothetical protein